MRRVKPPQKELRGKSRCCGRAWTPKAPLIRSEKRTKEDAGSLKLTIIQSKREECSDQHVRVAAAREFAAVINEYRGTCECLASIIFCAIIATGYSLDSSFRECCRDGQSDDRRLASLTVFVGARDH